MEKTEKEIFFNRAEVEEAERIACENCFEDMVFYLKDKDHEFSIGLSTVLECLRYAVESGELPKLPLSWVSKAYGIHAIAEDDKLAYYDG